MTMAILEIPVAEAKQAPAEPPAHALWVWRCAGRIGHGLPSFLFQSVAIAKPLIEPFAAAGPLSGLAKDWRAGLPREADERRLRAGLASVNALGYAIDDAPPSMDRAMIDAAAARPARHLVLYVRDSVHRLADRRAATSAPVSAINLVKQDRLASIRLARIQLALKLAGLPVHAMAFDDLAAAGTTTGDAAWRGLWAFLGVSSPGESIEAGRARDLQQEFADAAASLDSNWAELIRREAKWVAGPDMPAGCLRAVTRVVEREEPDMRLLRFDHFPSALLEGETIRLSGVAVPANQATEDRRLFVRQGGPRQGVTWDGSSPAIAARLPDEPAAARARFNKPTGVRVERKKAVSLLFRASGSATAKQVAELSFEPIAREPIRGIFVAPWSIGYQPIPKAACTSIKQLLFNMVVGEPYSSALGGGAKHVHTYFEPRMCDVSAADFRFLVVRDPVKRFLSAFRNRVLHHKELSKPQVESLKLESPLDLDGFPFDPSLDEFVERFDFYRRIPSIDHHFRPFSEFIAPLSAFDRVYTLERLGDLVEDLRRRTGVLVAMPHEQRGGPAMSIADIPSSTFDKLVEIYATDYRLLDGLYAPSDLR